MQLIMNSKTDVILRCALRSYQSVINEENLLLFSVLSRPRWVLPGETLSNQNLLGEEWLAELRGLTPSE